MLPSVRGTHPKMNTATRQAMYVTLRRVRLTNVAVSITYSECKSVALVVQYAKCMRPITLSPIACLALPYFSTLPHKRQDFRKDILNIKCVF